MESIKSPQQRRREVTAVSPETSSGCRLVFRWRRWLRKGKTGDGYACGYCSSTQVLL
ncbi:hypothetical protein Hanom_Chr00s000001g01598251 [Helianthus anomalus]